MPTFSTSISWTRVFCLACFSLLCASLLTSCSTTTFQEPGKSKVRGTSSYTVRGETYYPLQTGEGYVEEGEASWYGPGFHGKATANGERYNQNAMTAAHKTLPLGTDVRVTHLGNGQSIEVRINDRGPFLHGRIIDLSKRGAEKLGMKDTGTAQVRVEALSENGVPFATQPSSTYEDADFSHEEFSDDTGEGEYEEYSDEYSDDYTDEYAHEDDGYDDGYDDDYAEDDDDDGWFSTPKKKKRTLSDGPGGAANKKTLF